MLLQSIEAFKNKVIQNNIILPKEVRIVEVGPRDGLQNEKNILSLNIKKQLIDIIIESGINHIECGAFVSPKWVPQMANSKELINSLDNTYFERTISALVPNLKGLEMALDTKVNEIAVFTAASESFTKKNINCTIEESLEKFKPVIDKAKENGIKVRGYISCVVGCPYEGEIKPEKVNELAIQLLELGCYEVSLGDTIGIGTPESIDKLLSVMEPPVNKLAMHFHDTGSNALKNILVGLEKGLSVIDSSVGGLGGCPYAKKDVGNVCTENVVDMCEQLGIKTNVDVNVLKTKGKTIVEDFGRKVEYLYD